MRGKIFGKVIILYITKPKTQLRPVVAKWLARTQGYLTGTHDRWVRVMHTIARPAPLPNPLEGWATLLPGSGGCDL